MVSEPDGTYVRSHELKARRPPGPSSWIPTPSVAFTLDIYAHVLPGMQADAATQLRALVSDARTASTNPSTTERTTP